MNRRVKAFTCNDEDMIQAEKAAEYCSYADFSGNIDLPDESPDIGQVLSIIGNPEVESLKVIDTLKGTSAEGEVLTGKKAAVEVRLRYKISYTADSPENAIHIVEDEHFSCTYVVIPPLIEGTDPGILVKSRNLRAKAEVRDVSARKVGKRTLFRHIQLLLKVYLVPTYQLCFSKSTDKYSDIFICHDDGSNITRVGDPGYKNISPSWSPAGKEIAYLSNTEGRFMLYVFRIGDSEPGRVTDPSVFRSITSFCWSADGWRIFFSSSLEYDKELFSIDLYDNKWKQLTFGNSTIKSYRPRCSHDGRWIAFLKSISDITYLFVMDNEGLNCRKVSPLPGVKDFSWSCDSRHIACIRSTGGRPDEICVGDILSSHEDVLCSCDGVIHKKNVSFSPDGRYIAFIGSNFGTDDVYLYDMDHDSIDNITRNPSNIQVSSFAWKVDGTKIYYSTNELYHYNIYSYSLKDGSRRQLTNTEADGMELCYRPRIK